MPSLWRVGLALTLAALWSAPVVAQQPPGGADGTYYAPDDPLRQTKLKIEELMGVYALKWPQRDVEEVVQLDGKNIDVRVWVSIGSRDENDLTCKALQWLVVGRHQWAQGARGVFGEFPDLEKLQLSFLDVRVNREGDNGKKFSQSYMTLQVAREDFNTLDLKEMQDALDNEECTLFVRRNNMKFTFDKDYYNKYLQER